MTEASIWVGLLDLDDSGAICGVGGPLSDRHGMARVLIRMHRAPIGYVQLPTEPAESLTARATSLAERTLAEPLRNHEELDKAALNAQNCASWMADVCCPHRFTTSGGAGVTVIVCTRDRTEGLSECLRSIQRANYEPLEILVVDNSPSTDDTRQLVTALAKTDARINYTCEPNPGLSRARNHGLARAQFDLVCFTDDDTRVDHGWPSAVAAGFAADPETVCVTGLVATSSLNTGSERYFDSRYSWGKAFEPRRYDLLAHRHSSALYPYSAGLFGTGANFAVRRGTVTGLGGFDPILGAGGPGRGGEDLDMFLRVILAGGRICYLPSSVVWHQHRSDIGALGDQIYSYGYGLGAYLAKHLIGGQMPAVLLGRGLRQAGAVLGRTRQASQAGQMRAGGRRLAFTEARGVLAGALCYHRAARRPPAPLETRDRQTADIASLSFPGCYLTPDCLIRRKHFGRGIMTENKGPDVTVVICAYTERRWKQTCAALESVLRQEPPPSEVLLVVDHNAYLAERARREFRSVSVLENVSTKGLSGARNTGLKAAAQPITAFLDDDAEARPGWLRHLVAPYASPDVVATGGSVYPRWPVMRPRWLPPEFDWVVGCSYRGLPETIGEVRNPIGANMSMQTDLALEVGGFDESVGRVGANTRGCEETELSIRLTARRVGSVVLYIPAAAVDHHVAPDRLTFKYFRSRCWHEGFSKADVVRLAGASAGLKRERRQTVVVIPAALIRELGSLATGHLSAAARIFALIAGLATASVGYVVGRARQRYVR